MRFKEHNCTHIDFPGTKTGMVPEKQPDIGSFNTTIVINAFPVHPYDYPHIPLFLDLLEKHHHTLGQIQEKYKITHLILLINSRWKKAVREKGIFTGKEMKVVFKKPVYPVTEKRIASLTGAKDFSVIGWYEFIKLISSEQNIHLPGIPVSLTHPVRDLRIYMLVPQGTPLIEIAKAAQIEMDDSILCTDHPFRGELINPDIKVEKQKPHTFIFCPKNIRKSAPLRLKIKFMIFGYTSFAFSPTFDSRPLQLDTPCQKCLYCTKICPAGIVPFMLSALYTAENIKAAAKHSPELCIECGLCSYICPSGIPLLHDIMRLKKELGVSS